MFGLKHLFGGTRHHEVTEARERELGEVKSAVSNSIQAIQSGNRILSAMPDDRILSTLSGMIELQSRSKPS